MPAQKTSKKDPPGDKRANGGKQRASGLNSDSNSDSDSGSNSDSGTNSDSTLGDAERSSKKKCNKKKPKKKNKGKGKQMMGDNEEDETAALRDENARLQQELAELQELADQNRRDMLNASRPSQTTGAGPSNTNGQNTDADADTEQTRISIPEKKADITIELLLGYFGLTDSHEDHQKWLEWRDLIRHWMSMANLDYDRPWKQQDKSQLGKLYDLIRARIPAFKRFVNNWAAEYLVQDAFNHRRGHRMAKARDNEDGQQSPRKKRKVSTKTKKDKAANAPPQHNPRRADDQSNDTGMRISGEQDHTHNASLARDQSDKRKRKRSAKNTDEGPSCERVQEERDRERKERELERMREERERERAEQEREEAEREEAEREEAERERERERERKQWELEREKWEQERKEWERERERERQREKERERKREELDRKEHEREEELQHACEREQREEDQTAASSSTKGPDGKRANNGPSGRGRGGAPRRQRGLNIQVDGAPPASTRMTTRSRAGKQGREDRGQGNVSDDEDGGDGDNNV